MSKLALTARRVNPFRHEIEKNFVGLPDVARVPIEETIRERVEALLRERPEVKQYEFGRAIGRGYSWVSAFLKGKRPVTDVALLVRIARFFPVSAAYLLGESEREADSQTAVMFETWRLLPPRARKTVLGVARGMLQDLTDDNDAPSTPPAHREADGAPRLNKGRNRRGDPEPRDRKPR